MYTVKIDHIPTHTTTGGKQLLPVAHVSLYACHLSALYCPLHKRKGTTIKLRYDFGHKPFSQHSKTDVKGRVVLVQVYQLQVSVPNHRSAVD